MRMLSSTVSALGLLAFGLLLALLVSTPTPALDGSAQVAEAQHASHSHEVALAEPALLPGDERLAPYAELAESSPFPLVGLGAGVVPATAVMVLMGLAGLAHCDQRART